MGSFPRAFGYTIANETGGDKTGGFTNDPEDPGKATKWGITQASYTEYLSRPVSVDEVRAITRDDAYAFYRATRWRWIAGDAIGNDAVAMIVFDAATLFGVTGTVLDLQRAINAEGSSIPVDGHLGAQTITALNAIRPEHFAQRLEECLKDRINRIIVERPASEKYRDGWVARVERYTALFAPANPEN